MCMVDKEEQTEGVKVAVEKIDLLPIFATRDLKKADVDTLAESIGTVGLINPLIVRSTMGGRYELVSGHRRLMAVKQLGWKEVPARVVTLSDEKAFMVAMSENLERKDPTPLEEAAAFRRAVDELHLKEKNIAAMIHRSVAYVSNRLSLLKLIPEVQKALEAGKISAGICEKGFAKLKHEADQLELLEDLKHQRDIDSPAGVEEAKEMAEQLVSQREEIEQLAGYLQRNKDKIKFPVCPKCGAQPEPGSGYQNLSKDRLGCSNCYISWDPFKGLPKSRETTLGGNLSQRENAPRGETVVKVEATSHKSALMVQQFFDKIAELVTKNKAVLDLKVEEDSVFGSKGHLDLVVSLDPKKAPGVPVMHLEPKTYKNTPHVTKAEIYHSWGGGNNKDVVKNRELFWALEKAIEPKVQPAEISRVALERLVVDHMALSKGKVLYCGTYGPVKIHAVHRDYTAWMVTDTGTMVFMEEDNVRSAVKETRKAEKKPLKFAKPKKGEPGYHTHPKRPSGPGVCSKCSCTEDDPCIDEDGEPCSWANKERTLCSVCAGK
jgi:ParB/RepB/Spo0J family partition protein